jgi:hypothetical protein
MVFMPSLSLAALARCGVDIDLVTSFFVGMGLSDRRREGVILPEPCCTHGAAECMNLLCISHCIETCRALTHAYSAILLV